MNFKKFSVLIGVIMIFFTAKAEYTINGFVTDANTGEALIGVSIYSFDKKVGTISNNYGYYSLTLSTKRDSIDLFFSYKGYRTMAFKIKLTPKLTLNVQMEEDNQLSEVEVVAERKEEILDNPQVSKIDLSGAHIKRIPAIMGEPDVIKVIQLQPGVQKGNEAGTGLYVRGGGNDQNLILLDGAPLYNVSHTFNFFSVFNADAINYVSFYKGGFPSRFGERLSSVLDITMKEGNSKKYAGSFSIGTVSAKMLLEGPLNKSGKTTFMFAARRTYLDKLMAPLFRAINTDDAKANIGYYFYDLNFKMSHRISQNDRVFLSIYKGEDNLYTSFEDKFTDPGYTEITTLKAGLKWGNTLATMRWNHIFNSKLFANFMVDYTGYKTELYASVQDIVNYSNGLQEATELDFRLFNGIRDLGAKADFEYVPDAKHHVRFGMNYINHKFTPSTVNLKFYQTGFVPFDTTLTPSREVQSNELAGYIEDELIINKKIKVNYGLRLSSLFVDSTIFVYPEPRVSARYIMNKRWTLKASYAMVHQYIQRILMTSMGLPLDYWAPSTKYIKPQASQQVVFSSTNKLKYGFELMSEVYFKYSNNVNTLKSGADLFNAWLSNWEQNVEQGEAYSYGLELLLQKKIDDQWSGWLGYTLSKSDQIYPTVNFNRMFPTEFDRRHDITLVLMYTPNAKWNFALTYIFATGQPFTMATGKYYDVNGRLVLEYPSRNNVRLPTTKRLDFAFSKKRGDGEVARLSYDFSFYNVLFNANPSGAVIDMSQVAFRSYYRSFMPFMTPALSINYKF